MALLQHAAAPAAAAAFPGGEGHAAAPAAAAAAPFAAGAAAVGVAAPGDGVWAAAAGIGDVAGHAVAALEERRKELRRERDAVAKELRNAERKRQRLLERARGLTDNDLLSILATRAAAKAVPKAKGKAAAKATAKAAAKAAADA